MADLVEQENLHCLESYMLDKGLLIAICAAPALSFEGAVTAHSLFGYPVNDKDNVDDLNPAQ